MLKILEFYLVYVSNNLNFYLIELIELATNFD
jgi:hypothetical protein